MTPAELLHTAAASITDETWCQGALWRNSDGDEVDEASNACRFCALGALKYAAGATNALQWLNVVQRTVRIICDRMRVVSLSNWNDEDGRTASDVRALFLRVADEPEAQR